MISRRGFVPVAAGAALAVHSRAASTGLPYSEIEARIARKNFDGITKQDLGTPCLVLDEAIFQRNLETMAAHCKSAGIQLRPHVKVHKLTQVSQRQVALGAIGITAATIAECELFHAAGIRGILYSAQPAGRNKIGRTAVMGRRAPDFLCVVDDPLIADQLDAAAAAERTRLNVLVDITVSLPRQGTQAGEQALELAQKVDRSKHLKLAGLMGYSGVASHTKGWENRKRRSEGDLAPLIATMELCRKSGLPVKIVTGASTGTYNIDSQVTGMTELQAGSFVFMDSNYRRIGSKDGSAVYSDFGPALSVLSTVISKRRPNEATVDCGNKAMLKPTDEVKGRPDIKIENWGAEYGGLLWQSGDELRLGDRVEIYPSNLDMSVNCYDRVYVTRGEAVVDVWPVMGRAGAVQR